MTSGKILSSIGLGVLISTTAACPGSDSEDAVFSVPSDDNPLLVGAAQGESLGIFIVAAAVLADETGESCPSVTRTGNVATVEGGCSVEDGGRIEGSIRVESTGDGLEDFRADYDNFILPLDDGAGTLRLDGFITIAISDDEDDVAFEFDLTFDEVDNGEQTLFELRGGLHCLVDGCSWVDASAELGGLGSFGIVGTFIEDPAGGIVTLNGSNLMDIDFAEAGDCARITVDGTDAVICDDREGELRQRQTNSRDFGATLSACGFARTALRPSDLMRGSVRQMAPSFSR